MQRSDNPVSDFLRHDAEQAAELAKLPKCEYCGEAIQDEYCYEINDSLICEECLKRHFRRDVDDFI